MDSQSQLRFQRWVYQKGNDIVIAYTGTNDGVGASSDGLVEPLHGCRVMRSHSYSSQIFK